MKGLIERAAPDNERDTERSCLCRLLAEWPVLVHGEPWHG